MRTSSDCPTSATSSARAPGSRFKTTASTAPIARAAERCSTPDAGARRAARAQGVARGRVHRADRLGAARSDHARAGVALRLHFRNRLALLYSYLFPTLFLLAFWVLYRYDQVPLVRHMGALLTVTVLGGACFGLPTTIVSERERGVWRRYRLAPVSAGVAGWQHRSEPRYLLLVVAGLLQVVLAHGARHAAAAASARSLPGVHRRRVCISRRSGWSSRCSANSVPAVQALGQCLFLPMLIIGGDRGAAGERCRRGRSRSRRTFPGRYCGRGDPGDGDRSRARRRPVQRAGAPRDRRSRLRRRRALVPLGHRSSASPAGGGYGVGRAWRSPRGWVWAWLVDSADSPIDQRIASSRRRRCRNCRLIPRSASLPCRRRESPTRTGAAPAASARRHPQPRDPNRARRRHTDSRPPTTSPDPANAFACHER